MRLLFPGVCVEGKCSEWQSAVGPSPSVKSTFSNRLLSCHQRRPNDQGRFVVAVQRTLASRRFDYLTHCLARAHQPTPTASRTTTRRLHFNGIPSETRKEKHILGHCVAPSATRTVQTSSPEAAPTFSFTAHL